MKKRFFEISSSLIFILMMLGCSEVESFLGEQTGNRILLSVQMPIEETTRVSLSEVQNTKNLLAKWQEDDEVQVFITQDKSLYPIGNIQISGISVDGKSASIKMDLPGMINQTKPYTIYCFTGITGSMQQADDGTWTPYCEMEITRSLKSQLRAPMFAQIEIPDAINDGTSAGSINQRQKIGAGGGGVSSWDGSSMTFVARFKHIGTYEVLHLKNTSPNKAPMSHCGFNVEKPWYRGWAGVQLVDSWDHTNLWGEWDGDDSSPTIEIPSGVEGVFISSYMPSGFKMQSAQLILKHNGVTIYSSNKKSSEVEIQRGHAYHMYATWDGKELKFTNGDIEDESSVDGEVTTEQYEAAKATIEQNGWYKIFTRFNGVSLGTKKYYLKADGYLTTDESEAKTFRFGQVTGSNLFVSPGWKLDVPFTNPELTNGSTGDLLQKGHILTNSNNRNDWEGQVWYKNGDRYAVRSTNATSNTWGAGTYWTALDSNADGLPEADYSLIPKFVWQLEQSLMLSATSIYILNGDTETIEVTSGSGNYILANSDASVVVATLNNGNEIRLTAKKADKATITVTDTEIGTTTTLSVVVIDDKPVDSETFTVNGVSFDMVGIKGGAFWMGASEEDNDAYALERPKHLVTVSSFAIGQTEVTQELWEAVMGSNPSTHKGDKFPVEYVSWDDCQGFIEKLNQLTGRNFRMPTEAEWEYAARGGKRSNGFKYSGSNNIDEVAWYYSNSGRQPHNVATKSPNELGLYDMSGNVFEWTQDWYVDYEENSQLNPSGPLSGAKKVDRGGSYLGTARDSRISDRIGPQTTSYRYEVGLRLVLGGAINPNN